eukprot:CAMPEP_0181050090 /NCGR_PEP_ID=MMETSP1070-20121207/16336_1 /TAXON_ID=265543 /ORGANISM="Minutocellus polymorphus, Strain NH13" /LENGTH=118 /DNA_ID=CAMNT_0023129023 /DNA_START=59 /DNA_END=412 /DNA_ORIENTATION=+
MASQPPQQQRRWIKRSSLLIFAAPLCIVVALSSLHHSFLGLDGGVAIRQNGWFVSLRLGDAAKAENRSEPPNVLYTIFAGRKNRLLLQEPYWLEMYQAGAITEMHLWNYVNGFGGEEE